jgi:hypothetical protein
MLRIAATIVNYDVARQYLGLPNFFVLVVGEDPTNLWGFLDPCPSARKRQTVAIVFSRRRYRSMHSARVLSRNILHMDRVAVPYWFPVYFVFDLLFASRVEIQFRCSVQEVHVDTVNRRVAS